MRRLWMIVIIVCLIAACTPNSDDDPLPTLASLPSITPSQPVTATASATATVLSTTLSLTSTLSATPDPRTAWRIRMDGATGYSCPSVGCEAIDEFALNTGFLAQDTLNGWHTFLRDDGRNVYIQVGDTVPADSPLVVVSHVPPTVSVTIDIVSDMSETPTMTILPSNTPAQLEIIGSGSASNESGNITRNDDDNNPSSGLPPIIGTVIAPLSTADANDTDTSPRNDPNANATATIAALSATPTATWTVPATLTPIQIGEPIPTIEGGITEIPDDLPTVTPANPFPTVDIPPSPTDDTSEMR